MHRCTTTAARLAAPVVVGVGLLGSARAEPAGLTRDEAASAYVAAVAPLNEAYRDFAEGPAAAALLDAFEEVAAELDALRADYEPAAAELAAVAAAVDEVIDDLEARRAWEKAFDGDIHSLTVASNELRRVLGLPSTRR